MTHATTVNQRHELASELFLHACELPQAEQGRFLEHACGHDEALRSEVLDLLRHDSTLAAIDRPIVAVSSAVTAIALEALKPVAGTRIGRYEILDVLGQGGMGTIYRARQENPDRVIALKVIRAGIASPSTIKRFELEARVLGRLHHPGIAQIHEAGTADTGDGAQPYFAMELVAGRSLLEYATEANLDTSQRLELIANICDAVRHAHQKSIIHRDLKPTNILVNESGQPKILDFGVARVTDSDLKATTIHTSAGELVGTIPYMSPEQLAGDPSEVDVRSDVYAIGVIAFELLSGRLPYDLFERSMLDAARIVQLDPPLRLSSIDRAFRGDIETIIARALEKEKERRYQSASELAADIRRYLGDEPIVARPPSALYQMRKFARRNRALVAGGALGVAALVLAAGISAGFAIHSHRAAQRESKQRQIAERTSDHLQRMLTLPDPHGQGAGLTVLQMLDLMIAQLNSGQEIPEVEAELRRTIGTTYLHLRQPQQAATQLQRAVELWRQIDPSSPQLAHALLPLGTARLHLEDSAASEAAYREAIPILDRLGGTDANEARSVLLEMLLRTHRFQEAAPVARALLDAARHENDLVMTIARLRQLGKVECGIGANDEGERLLIEARELAAKNLAENHPIQIGVLLDLAMTRSVRGDYPAALAATTDAFELTLRVGKPGSYDWKQSMTAQMQVLSALGRTQDMVSVLERARAAAIAALGEDDPLVRETNAKLAQLRGK